MAQGAPCVIPANTPSRPDCATTPLFSAQSLTANSWPLTRPPPAMLTHPYRPPSVAPHVPPPSCVSMCVVVPQGERVSYATTCAKPPWGVAPLSRHHTIMLSAVPPHTVPPHSVPPHNVLPPSQQSPPGTVFPALMPPAQTRHARGIPVQPPHLHTCGAASALKLARGRHAPGERDGGAAHGALP